MEHTTTDTYTLTVTKLPNAMVELSGEVSWEAFAQYEEKAFSRLAVHLEIPGFRKGHVPTDVARKHVGDELVLSDMAELAMQELYPRIIAEHTIDAIGRPELSITKIARGNALGFTIRTATVPEIALPDFKRLAKTIAAAPEAAVTQVDVDKVIEDLRQIRAYGHVHSTADHDHGHEEPLPEVTDEFAKSFGDFATVAEMREKVRENLVREKSRDAKDKRRIDIMEAIIAQTAFDVPVILLKSEQEKMIAQVEADIARSGMTLEDYLKHTQKTKEAMMEEFAPEAEKRARFQLVINAIARAEKIAPTDEEVENEAQHMMAQYPGADINRSRAYADMILTNDKTLSMLESQ